jgi:hypothetical protein
MNITDNIYNIGTNFEKLCVLFFADIEKKRYINNPICLNATKHEKKFAVIPSFLNSNLKSTMMFITSSSNARSSTFTFCSTGPSKAFSVESGGEGVLLIVFMAEESWTENKKDKNRT